LQIVATMQTAVQKKQKATRSATRARDIMTTSVLTIGAGDDLRLALQMMLWGGCRHLPVVESGRIIGVISEHDIHRVQAEQSSMNVTVADVMSNDVLWISPNASVSEVAAMMADVHIGSLPVVAEGRLVGIITSTDVLTHVARGLRMERPDARRVGEVMCSPPRSVTVRETLADALLLMVGTEVRHLPVVDGSGVLVGMLSDRDVRELVGDPVAVLRDETFSETLSLPVEEVMKRNPVAARADQPLETLAWALLDERVGAVPVIDDADRLVGIVSYVDVLHHSLRRL
jgi:CBS domain-containing protein